MSRGFLKFISNHPNYIEAPKNWHIELSSSTCFWYDLIIHPPVGFDTKQQITSYLKSLQSTVENQLDKRFIYFLAARRKVRFCTSSKPKYSFFHNDLTFYIEIGREKIRKKITTKIFDAQTLKPIKPQVEVCDRFITFYYAPHYKESISIYDFFLECNIEIGINTEIHYVGYTKNPSERPINRSHRGLADMLYKVSNEELDFFIFYNLFKVLSVGLNPNSLINYCVANSMIDEINVDQEGRIIEKVLIKYFSAEQQKTNKKNEEAELENSLNKLVKENNIKSIVMHIEMEQSNELYRFFSKSVAPSDKHFFTCHVGDNGVEII